MKTQLLRVFEFAEVVSGGTPATGNPSYWGGRIPWITPKDMSNHAGVCISAGSRFITDRGLRESSAVLVPPNTVILSSRAPVGYVAVAAAHLATNQGCKNLVCESSVADYRFVYYMLKRSTALLEANATGSTYKELSASRLKNIPFDLPKEINVQARIADLLSAYDDLIENNRRRIKLLERAARLLYREWFVRLRFPGHEAVAVTDGVPEGWERRRLAEICDTQYGFTASATDEQIGPKFLRGTDINKTSYIDWASVPYCAEEKLAFRKYALAVGDIVVIRMADPGKAAIVETEVRAVFASYLVRLTRKPGIGIPPLYLFFVLDGDDYRGFISSASSGTTRKSASARLLVDYTVVLPTHRLMAAFVSRIRPMRQQIQLLLRQNRLLAQARDLLLPRLMNGEIAV